MRIKSGESVFVFVDGVTVETFEKDEDFRSGTVTSVVAGKVRIEWDETVSVVRGGRSVLVAKYEYVPAVRLTRVERETWVLDYKSAESIMSGSPDMDQTPEMPDVPVVSEVTETPVVPVQSRKSRSSAK